MKSENKEPMGSYLRKKLREALLLYEGLIKTYSVEETLRMLDNIDISEDCIRVYYNNTPKFYILIENNKDSFNILNQKFDLYGWFFSDAEVGDNYYKNIEDVFKLNIDKIWVSFSAKFDVLLSVSERSNYYYHVTTKYKLDNILKIGLTPKTNSKIANHPDRIYLLTINNNEIIEQLIHELFMSNTLDYKYKKEYVLLRIYIPNTPPLRLFRDSETEGGVYSIDNIKPEKIKVIKYYNIDKNGDVKQNNKLK